MGHGGGDGRYHLFWRVTGQFGVPVTVGAIGVVMAGTALWAGLFWNKMSERPVPLH